ncbi:PTS sugar transporter subunit IIA [candidate division KSB1 bacterium]|nr:PTS sugar transporter subunit IIA [candidate division KSB1 bacterium]
MSKRLNEKPDILFKLLVNREKAGSTAISPGIAIPHIILDGKHTANILLARCNEGINFSEKAPMVNAVFALVGSKDEHNCCAPCQPLPRSFKSIILKKGG